MPFRPRPDPNAPMLPPRKKKRLCKNGSRRRRPGVADGRPPTPLSTQVLEKKRNREINETNPS